MEQHVVDMENKKSDLLNSQKEIEKKINDLEKEMMVFILFIRLLKSMNVMINYLILS